MRNERMKKWISMVLCLCMLVQNAPVMAFAATTDNLCDHHAEHTADCGYVEASAGSACTHEHSEDCYAIVSCLHECGDACAEGCVHECTVENGCIVMEKDCHHTHGDCGYAEAVAPQECTTCQSVLVHAENCGYVAPVAEVTCACVPGEDGTVTHTEGCGYVAAVEEETCACEPTVTHGGEGCTYAEGKAGSPCTHVCAVVVDSADSCYQLLCSHRDGGHDDACGYVAAVEGHECHYECAECAIAPANEEPGDETPVCTCNAVEGEAHAEGCPLYVAPVEPVCTCTVRCGETVDTTCTVCSADPTACEVEEPPVAATDNIDAAEMTPEDLKAAVDAALAARYTAITVNLAEDAGEDMFSAITAALATTVDPSLDQYELVMNYSGTIDLTISGAKTVPECTFYVDEYVNENWRAGAALRSVTLTDAITIGESAFAGSSMTSFSAPNVIEIEGFALEGCMKLTDVYLPSVQTLGDAVFSDCYALKTISLPECIDLGNGVFNSCEALETVYAPKATNLGAIEFMLCTSLMKVTLGSVVSVNQRYESIDNGLFCLANDTKNIELILACDQKALSFDSGTKYWAATEEAFAGDNQFIGYTFKSITLAHTPVADDGDCTTAVKCATCGETVVEAKESHTTELAENKATCQNKAKCDLCGTEYGEVDSTNHYDGCPHPFYTLTISSDKGLFEDITIQLRAGDLVTEDMLPDTEYEHYEFKEWVDYETWDPIEFPMEMPAHDMEICAWHSPVFYEAQVILTPDESDWYSFFYGEPAESFWETMEFMYADVVWEGHSRTGWEVKDRVTGYIYQDGEETVSTVDLIITAQWKCESLTHVEAKAGTCSAEGNIEYYECSCGKRYADAEAATLLTGEVTTPKDSTNHTWNDGTCTGCGAECAHETYTDGICDGCGYVCPHDYFWGGECETCGIEALTINNVYVQSAVSETLTGVCAAEVEEPDEFAAKTTQISEGPQVMIDYNILLGKLEESAIIGVTVTDDNNSDGSGYTGSNIMWVNNAADWYGEAYSLYDTTGGQQISAYYPYSEDGILHYDLAQWNDQPLYGAMDVTGTSVDLTVERKMAKLAVNIAGLPDGQSVQAVELNGIYLTADFDGATGILTPDGDKGAIGMLQDGKAWTTMLIPMDENEVTIRIQLENGDVYAATFQLAPAAGTTYNLTVSLGHTDVKVTPNDDGETHALTCEACGETFANEKHTGGTATCNRGKICDLCGTEYGEKDANNHTGTLGTPVPTEDDTQHIATWSCCEATVTEEHSFDETGKCVCGTYIITIGNVTAKNFDGTDRVWQSGDTIRVDVWDKDNGGYERTELTYDGTSWGSIITDTQNPVVFAVIGNGMNLDVNANKNSYFISVSDQQEQSPNVDDYDLMYAYKASVNTDAQLDLHFEHLFTKITVNIEYGSEFTETPKVEYVLFISEPLKPVVTITGINDGNLHFEYAEDWIHPSQFINYGDEADMTDDTVEVIVGIGTLPAGYDFIHFYDRFGSTEPWKKVLVPEGGLTFVAGEAYEYNVLITSDGAKLLCAGEHSFTYTPNEDGTSHKKVCSDCGYAVTEEHTLLTYSASGNVITGSCSKCPAVGTATITAENTTYKGTAQETATVAYSEGWNSGELTVSYVNNVNAGTATASITVGEATASVEFTIAKAEIDGSTLINPEFAEGLIYNGTAQALVTKIGSVDGGYIVYSPSIDGEYTTTIPVATEAGTYRVYWTIECDENHYVDGTPGSSRVTIAKANPEYTVPTGLTATYGDTLANVELPTGWAWKDAETTFVGNAGTRTFKALYNPDSNNYNTVEADVTVEVVKADPEYTVPTGLTANYGDTLADVELPTGWAWNDAESTSVGNAGTRTFKALYNPDSNNYNTVEADITVEVAKALIDIYTDNLINPEFAEGLIYNGTAQALVTNSGSIDGGYIVFSLNPDGEYTTEIPVATEAGEYVVFYRIEGDENHYWEGSSAFEAVTIAAKNASNATVTLDDTSVPFDGTEKTPGITSVIVDGKTLNAETDYEVSYSNNIYVGTATVTITFKGNYTGNAIATFTIVRAAAPAIQWPTAGSLTYGQKLSESTLTSEDANGTFAWENGEQIPTVTNSGYVVVYTPKDADNYDYSNVTLTKTIPVTVSKAPASVETAPAANTLIYTGEAQALVTAGAAKGGEMQYSTDNQTWSTAIPKGTNAGEYTVYYKVVGDANHIDTDVQSVVVKIGQLAVAEPTVSGTYTYTGKEQMVTLTGVESCMTVASGDKATNAGSYEAVITLDGNHKWADGSDGKVQWSIGKAEFGDVYVSQSGMLTYNGTAQTPNVNTDADSVGDQTATFAYRLTENESYGEMPAFTDAGTYTVYYKASAPNHKDATGSFTVMVDKAKAEITVDTDPITVTYGDTVELPDATANFGTVSCDKTAAELVNVGTYTVTYTVAGTDNYDGDTKTVTVKINPKAITEDDVQLNGSLVYTGSEQTQQITVTAGIDFEVTGNKATNVGSYTLTVTASGNYTGSVTKDWSIKAAGAIVETAPKANNLTYTGEALALITAGTAKGGKLVYSLSENGTYTETIPTGTNAGEYTVWYYVDGDYNHSDSAKASVKVTIAKATAEITVDTTPITVTYGETVELPDATSNFGTVSCDKTAAELVNAGTYTVTYTVEGTDNYEGDTKTVTITIEKLAVAEPTVTGTYTYTGEEQTAQLTGVESCMTVASADKATNAGSYEVEITLDGNHQWAEGSDGKVQWSIGKAQAEIAVNTDPITAVYGGTVKLPEATANFGTVTCDTTADKLVNAGTYTVTYTVASTANFDGDSKTVTVTVNPKAITEADVSLNGSLVYTGSELTQAVTVTAGVTYEVTGNKATNVGTYELTVKGTGNYAGEVSLTWSIKAAETAVVTAPRANTLTYTGAAQALVTEGTAKGGKLVYGLTENGTYAETVPTAKNAGSYTVWYYVQGDDNHTDSAKASVKVTIAKAKAEISVNTTPITVTYGEAVMLPTATSSFGTVSRDKTAAELVNAGTYTVTYTVEGTANYEGDTKTLTVIVEKKAVAEPAVTGTYTYTGEEQTAQLTGVESCMTIASGDKATNAGSYEVVITLDGNHKWADGSDGKVQWSIGKAEFGDVYVSQSGMLTYNGTAQTPNVNTDADSVGDQTATFAYRLTENESYGEMPAFTDAGTYTVYYKASAPNHKDATGSFTVTVDKAKAEIAVNTDPITVVYGEAVVLPTATTNFGTVACDKTASDLVNAGTYTVTYSVAGSDNYNGDTKTITVTVNAKVVNQPVIEGIEAVYILSENAITPVPTAVKDGATVIDPSEYTLAYENNTAAGTATVKIVDKDGGNYTVNGSMTFQIVEHEHTWTYTTDSNASKIIATCSNADGHCPNTNGGSVSIQDPDELTYDGSTKDAELVYESWQPEEVTITYNNVDRVNVTGKEIVASIGVVGAGIQSVYTIVAAALPNATLSADSGTYTGQAHTVTVVLDTLVKDTDYTVSIPEDMTNVGTKTITVNGKGNYEGTQTLTYTISKADPSVTTAPAAVVELVYNGRNQNLITTGTATGGTMHYSLDGETWTAAIPAGKNAGEYTVHYKVVGDSNHNDADAETVTVTIAKAAATVETIPTQKHFHYAAATKSLDLSSYLPADRGETTFTLDTKTGTVFENSTAITANTLSYTTKVTEARANGEIKVKVVMENYEDVTLTVKVELVAVTAQTEERIVKNDLAEVPVGLANDPELDTVAEIKDAQKRVLDLLLGHDPQNNIAHYDVKLQFSPDGGKTWVDATEENFPEAGLTVTLPYPSGTGKDSHRFVVSHMFTTGSKAGTTETPAVTKTATGIRFKVTGLSPVSVAWEAIPFDVKIATVTNGTVYVSPAHTEAGTQVTITATPKSGYKLSTLTVKDAAGNSYTVSTDNNDKYYFTMPAADVTVTATFTAKSNSVADTTNPKTGDSFQLVLWSSMTTTSLLALAVLLKNKKKYYQK